jgi:hypothetical protein
MSNAAYKTDDRWFAEKRQVEREIRRAVGLRQTPEPHLVKFANLSHSQYNAVTRTAGFI